MRVLPGQTSTPAKAGYALAPPSGPGGSGGRVSSASSSNRRSSTTLSPGIVRSSISRDFRYRRRRTAAAWLSRPPARSIRNSRTLLLVGGMDHQGVGTGVPNALAYVVLALLLVADRRVVADGRDKFAHLAPEQRLELPTVSVRVLQHVMQHGRRDDVIRTARAFQIGGHLQWMHQEGRAICRAALPAMQILRERDRPSGDRQVPREAEIGARPLAGRHALKSRLLSDLAAAGVHDADLDAPEHIGVAPVRVGHAKEFRGLAAGVDLRETRVRHLLGAAVDAGACRRPRSGEHA